MVDDDQHYTNSPIAKAGDNVSFQINLVPGSYGTISEPWACPYPYLTLAKLSRPAAEVLPHGHCCVHPHFELPQKGNWPETPTLDTSAWNGLGWKRPRSSPSPAII